MTGGQGANAKLTVKFNSKATDAAINQLVKQINFRASGPASIGTSPTVQMQLIKPDGTVGSQSTRVVNILAPIS
ncbi:MAG: hypothetical protein JWM11_6582 [Planctomycetaceae bacterium]|nr:hypothetical protein [Planctomycetaceae bacterium]